MSLKMVGCRSKKNSILFSRWLNLMSSHKWEASVTKWCFERFICGREEFVCVREKFVCVREEFVCVREKFVCVREGV